jgi:hypothetical protein
MSFGADKIRHRFGYHPASTTTASKHEQVREAFIAFGDYLDSVLPDGRAKELAFDKLQEASMWSNFRIAEFSPLVKKRIYKVTDHDDSTDHAATETAAG